MTPIRTLDQLTQQANNLLMRCYEIQNSTNCNGYTPQKTFAPDYLRAKRKALQIAKQYKDTDLFNHIKTSL